MLVWYIIPDERAFPLASLAFLIFHSASVRVICQQNLRMDKCAASVFKGNVLFQCDDGFHLKESKRRNDIGNGDCMPIWVKKLCTSKYFERTQKFSNLWV